MTASLSSVKNRSLPRANVLAIYTFCTAYNPLRDFRQKPIYIHEPHVYTMSRIDTIIAERILLANWVVTIDGRTRGFVGLHH